MKKYTLYVGPILLSDTKDKYGVRFLVETPSELFEVNKFNNFVRIRDNNSVLNFNYHEDLIEIFHTNELKELKQSVSAINDKISKIGGSRSKECIASKLEHFIYCF